MTKSKIARLGKDFEAELDEVRAERKERGIDEKRISNQKLTNKIPKHKFWKKIKEDLIEFHFNKKGVSTINLMLVVCFCFFVIVLLGIAGFFFNTLTVNIAQNVEVGSVNLGVVTNQTIGQINRGLQENLDVYGIILLFSMVMGMFMIAFLTRGQYPRLMIIIDFLLLIFAYVLAVYIANTYEILINAASILDVWLVDMPKSSTFILNLPGIVAIVGVVTMILSYMALPKEDNESVVNLGVSG